MSIFTSLWFWILVIGILLTITGVVIWIVTGNADIVVGLLLGFGVGWIIGGLVFWIFGRPKAPPAELKQGSPVAVATQLGTVVTPMPIPVASYNTNVPSGAINYPLYTSGTGAGTGAGTMNPIMNTAPYNAGIPPSTNYGMSQQQQQQLLQLIQNNPQLLNSYGNTSGTLKI